MFNNQAQETKEDSFPQWNTVTINKRLVEQKGGFAQVCMDHYLIFLAHEYVPGATFMPKKEPRLLAFDLRDNSVQEAKLCPSMFPENLEEFTFTKYRDNQIIRFGGGKEVRKVGEKQTYGAMIRITIESLKPFSVKCEEINVNGEQLNVTKHTAQIYNDCLYVYGGDKEKFSYEKETILWSFDLNNFTWKMCESSGEIPNYYHRRSSSVLQDNLYIYAGDGFHKDNTDTKDIFVLNLNSMIWTKLEQKETYLMNKVDPYGGKEFDSVLYKDHLLILSDAENYNKSETEPLCCWNPTNNSWTTSDVETNKTTFNTRRLTVSNNLLVSSGFIEGGDRAFGISILNLHHVDLQIQESPEQKRLRSLFMSEEESDVKFKVQDQIIPAHKQVLMQKSKYFANLFNSGMSESRQDIIEIPDFDSLTFQEFLRFLYCDEVQLDVIISSKLLAFADKYVQNDLIGKCMFLLKYDINQDNVYKILDFARHEDISHLKNWCLNFLKNKITPKNISGLVEYLNKQNNSEFAQENLELRDKAINILTNNFIEATKNQNTPLFEDFLINYLALDTVSILVNFISGCPIKIKVSGGLFSKTTYEEKTIEELKEKLQPLTINLRAALYNFVQRNLETLTESKVIKEIPHAFLVDLLRDITKAQSQDRKKLHGEQQTSQ